MLRKTRKNDTRGHRIIQELKELYYKHHNKHPSTGSTHQQESTQLSSQFRAGKKKKVRNLSRRTFRKPAKNSENFFIALTSLSLASPLSISRTSLLFVMLSCDAVSLHRLILASHYAFFLSLGAFRTFTRHLPEIRKTFLELFCNFRSTFVQLSFNFRSTFV